MEELIETVPVFKMQKEVLTRSGHRILWEEPSILTNDEKLEIQDLNFYNDFDTNTNISQQELSTGTIVSFEGFGMLSVWKRLKLQDIKLFEMDGKVVDIFYKYENFARRKLIESNLFVVPSEDKYDLISGYKYYLQCHQENVQEVDCWVQVASVKEY